MIVIKRQCEVHLSQDEIDCLGKVSDILNEIWSVMSASSYIGKAEIIDTETVGKVSDVLQELMEIGENIVIEDT